MGGEPATYIRCALSSLGVECRSLLVKHHDAEVFGNLVAEAETNRGRLQITYDRGFVVELDRWPDDGLTAEQIVKALEQAKIAPANVR